MSWQDCLDAIRRAAGDRIKLSDDEIERLIDAIRKKAARDREGVADPEGIRIQAAAMADAQQRAAAIQARNRLMNLSIRVARRERIAAAPTPQLGFRAIIHGVNAAIKAGRLSAEGTWKTLEARWIGGMTQELIDAGLYRTVRNGVLEREWVRELAELAKGDQGRPGISGSPEALQIARIVSKYQGRARLALNRAGAAINDYFGYVTRTAHDADKIRGGGKDADYQTWRDFIKPLLADETFDYTGGRDTPEAEAFLRGAWRGLSTGEHLTHEGQQGFKDPAFIGPMNLARKVSENRILHFRDADSWYAYQQRFGYGTVLDNVMNNLHRSARATALMQHFGTNPRAEFDGDIRYFRQRYTKLEQFEQFKQLENWQQALTNRFDFLDGTADRPANRFWARMGAGIRAVQTMARLGYVVFTHLSVAATKAAELRYQGVGLLERYGNFFSSFGGRNVITDELLAGLEGWQRDMVSAWSMNDTAPGVISKLVNTYFRWNPLTYLMNHQRMGHETMLARHLGRQFGKDFAGLIPESQRLLRQFDISEREWDMLRAAPDHAEYEGKQYLTPKAAERIPDDVVVPHLEDIGRLKPDAAEGTKARAADAYREDLAVRVNSMYRDSSARAVIMPNIETKAIMYQNLRPGTFWGEFARFVGQFKQWPVAAIQQGLGREFYGGQSIPSAVAGVVQLAVAGAVVGYGILAAKAFLAGKMPRDPAMAKTWFASLMQSGGFGILGDFLFGEYNRFGRNPYETAAGPFLGETFGTAYDIWQRIKASADDPSKAKDIPPELFRTLVNNIPFINLLGLRTALNYLFLWQVQEALNPGSVRRMERKSLKDQGQRYWLSPTRAIGQ